MLIWITAPSAAIGIFVLFVLLSAVPSEGNPIANISDESTTPTPITVSNPLSWKISDLPFVNHIVNPCTPGTRRNNDRDMTKTELHEYSIVFFRFMAGHSTMYKQHAQRVANQSTLNDCGFLNLPNMPNSPSLSELKELETEAALKRIHSSLLLHAAYAYFVEHQFTTFGASCTQERARREQNIARESLILAKKQKHMACMTQMTIEELGYSMNATDSLLNETFTNLNLCSRRAIRDCQIMISISNLLDVIGNYFRFLLESMDTK